MLDEHLLTTQRPVANAKNVIFFKNYRITVLTDRLFRIEKSENKTFTDEATQSFWFRDAEPVHFTAKVTDSGITVSSNSTTVYVDEDYNKSYAVINGKKIPLTNKGNLLGTYRTLDQCHGKNHITKTRWEDYGAVYEKLTPVKLCNGVCSETGVAIIDDKDSLILKNGEISPRNEQEKDDYVFAYGNDYAGAVKALYDVTGRIPMLPRFALGNWWSRYHDYTDEEYLDLIDKFEEADIPLTVATIDMDWHYSHHIWEELDLPVKTEESGCDPKTCSGWTGYTWNKRLFPDYKSFLQEIVKRNLKITLNLHPADGVRYFEKGYEEMCKATGTDPEAKKPVAFDMTNHDFINAYFSVLHKPYENDGVAFWWIDWQQGSKTKMAGLDPLWALNHYHYLDNSLNHDKGLILSRFAGIGSHRYPVGFSGDTTATYETLDYLPYFTATASNVGYSWWSHDIGGHMHGEKTDELFVRHVQYGVFSPILRLHCSNSEVMSKEPWVYKNGTGGIIADALRFRHRLIPFLYTENYLTHTEGKTLVQPLYYRHRTSDEAYKY
ncbi:MAG: alpha-xylosidase, partial [Clostridia bacterium]|nr:alpha-xylosidase [Clostridia bacterium]